MQRQLILKLAMAAAMATPLAGHAQSAVVGSLGNFDAANREGRDVYGFEVELHGVSSADLSPSWCGNKYGCPEVQDFPGGVYVRYKSAYDAASGSFTTKTVPYATATFYGGTCYTWGANYLQAGCDHFGVHINYTAAARAVTGSYRWLLDDPANPGQLVASPNNIFVPTPVYTVIAPAQPTLPPVLQVEIETPPPPPAQLYGDATWVKTYKTKLTREAGLDELVTDNPIVPETPDMVESEWELMQASPPPDGRHRQRNKSVHADDLTPGVRAVVRRYETFAYTGAYDPVTHEALCADLTCTAPQDGELGDMQTTQMVAANVANPSIGVTIVGSGKVSSADKIIACGSKCAASYALGTVIQLTAQPSSNNVFRGWTGACTGTDLTCTLTIEDALTTTATFAAAVAAGGGGGGGGGSLLTLQVSATNGANGVVTAVPNGDKAINCGKDCSARYPAGTAVTLTATPVAGKSFLGWTGGCTGAAPQCTVTMNANVSTQAAFSK
jgi:hypothetical protein